MLSIHVIEVVTMVQAQGTEEGTWEASVSPVGYFIPNFEYSKGKEKTLYRGYSVDCCSQEWTQHG